MDVGPAEETAATIRSAGGRRWPLAVDVTNREQFEAAVARAAQEFGRLDILVALAGITRDNLLFKMTDDDWDGVIDTHLKGSFIAGARAQKYMVEQRYGKMIFTSSTSALGNRGQSNYSTAKAGLQGLTRTLAIELGQFNINVNAVAPGFIETRMTQQTAERMGVDWEEFKKDAAHEHADAAHGQARGRRQRDRVPGQRRGELCERPDHLRRRGAPRLRRRSGLSSTKRPFVDPR